MRYSEVMLDLAVFFNDVYEEAGYSFLVDYTKLPEPPLRPDWAEAHLQGKQNNGGT